MQAVLSPTRWSPGGSHDSELWPCKQAVIYRKGQGRELTIYRICHEVARPGVQDLTRREYVVQTRTGESGVLWVPVEKPVILNLSSRRNEKWELRGEGQWCFSSGMGAPTSLSAFSFQCSFAFV